MMDEGTIITPVNTGELMTVPILKKQQPKNDFIPVIVQSAGPSSGTLCPCHHHQRDVKVEACHAPTQRCGITIPFKGRNNTFCIEQKSSWRMWGKNSREMYNPDILLLKQM